MNIIISPAKQMKFIDDFHLQTSKPIFLKEAKKLSHHLSSLNYDELKNVMNCSEAIAKKTYALYQNISFDHDLTPSLLSYQGIQYQYMANQVFTDDEYEYLQKHLRILSGLYGILRPFDEITIYRLEMQAKCPFSLYEFWSDKLANALEEDILLNLASEEYAKCIRKYKPLIDVKFCQEENGKLKEKGVYAKMARGAMVRYLAEIKASTIEQVKSFDQLHYQYSKEHSTPSKLIFIQKQ